MTTPALLLAALLAASPQIKQDVSAGDALVVTDADAALPDTVVQAGRLKPYVNNHAEVGLQFRTGAETAVDTDLKPANAVATTIMGAHGEGTHVRYAGHWVGDASAGFPILSLTDGGKVTWEADAVVDFVMPDNFFTRQLWVHGDGTGTLELAEGFVADRTQDATVPNAMGTIRLGGATLVTHHSRSLPYNSRPDGRGGIYHNGHVVFEQQPGSTWVTKTNQHVYAAQIDFAVDGTIDCQAALTHNGQRRVCLPVGNGGPFVSSGAFRTTRPDVTITKTGPAMLSLEGQQSYEPGATLVIKQGLVRLYTDPGDGGRVSETAGAHLVVEVHDGATLHVAAPTARVASITLKPGATLTIEPDTQVVASEGVVVEAGAAFDAEARVDGEVTRK